MRTVTTSLLTALLLASACGQKTTPPAPTPAPTPAPGPTPAPAPAPTPAPAPAPTPAPATSDDLILWFASETGRESLWLRDDEVLATRVEAVTFAGGKLWALGERWRVVKVYPCNEEGDGDRTATPKEVPTSTLVARELGGASEQKLAESVGEEAVFDGDLDRDGAWTHLFGSIGGKVFVNGGSSSYGCGAAHPYVSDTNEVRDLVTGESAPIEADKALEERTIAAIKAARVASDYQKCAGDDAAPAEAEVTWAMPSTLSLRYEGGVAHAAWMVFQESGLGEAGRACDVDALVAAPLDATLGYGPIDPRVAKVVASRSGQGHFGFSNVPAATRDALLALFRQEPPTFQPAPATEAAPAPTGDESATALVAKGRKLTLAKDFTGAIAAFDAAIAKDDKLASAWSGRGYARFLAKDAAAAKADFERALALEAKDAKFQAAIWFNLGLLAESQSDTAGARAAYARAVELNPSDAAKKALERVSK